MEGRRPGGWLPPGRFAAHPLMSTAHGDLDEVAFEVVVNNEPTDCCTSDELSGTLLASTRPCDLCVAPAVRTATRAHPQPRLPPHRPRLVEVGLEVAVGLLHGAHSPTCAFMLASLHLDHVAAHTTTARPHLLTHRAASPCPQDHHQPTSMTPTSMTATSTQHGTGSLRCRPASIRRSLDQTEVCLLPVRPDHRRRRHRCRRCRRRHHRCRPTTSPTSAQRGRRQGRHCGQASSTLAAAHLPSPSLLPLLPLPSPLSPGALAAAALGTLLPDAATSAAARGCGRRWRPREQLLVGVVRSHSPPVCEHSS